MNVYDNANELAKAMRESHEFKKLKEATATLNKDADAKKMVDEFLALNQQAEIEKYQGNYGKDSKAVWDPVLESRCYAISEFLYALPDDAG